MIKAVPKPLEEVLDLVKDFTKVLIAGCDGCVTVCEAGGLKEAKVLASALRLYFTQAGRQAQIDEISLTRQCEKEYLAQLSDKMDAYDAVVSLACGCGVQYMAEMYNNKIIYPGVDTCFLGVNEERGLYSERCRPAAAASWPRPAASAPSPAVPSACSTAPAAAPMRAGAKSTKISPAVGS